MPFTYFDRKKVEHRSFMVLLLWSLAFWSAYVWADQLIIQFVGEVHRENLRLYMREITNLGLAAHYFVGSAVVYVATKVMLHGSRDSVLAGSILGRKTNSIYKVDQGATEGDAEACSPQTAQVDRRSSDGIRSKWNWYRLTRVQLQYYNFWAKTFFLSLCISGLVNLLLKVVFGRQRPHRDPNFVNDIWSFFTVDWNFHSFPSGHTQVMVCAATMLSLAFPKWEKLFWILAVVIGATRIGTLYHFPSDVLTGGVIGYLGTLWTLYFFDSQKVLWNHIQDKLRERI